MQAWSLENGAITELTLHPTTDFGLPLHPLSTVRGGPSSENAQTLTALLTNAPAPSELFPSSSETNETKPSFEAIRDFVLLNASAVLVVSGKAKDFKEGVRLADESMRGGGAMKALDGFRRTAGEAMESISKSD
jgi:anthranilate phosphoribosyltransferase